MPFGCRARHLASHVSCDLPTALALAAPSQLVHMAIHSFTSEESIASWVETARRARAPIGDSVHSVVLLLPNPTLRPAASTTPGSKGSRKGKEALATTTPASSPVKARAPPTPLSPVCAEPMSPCSKRCTSSRCCIGGGREGGREGTVHPEQWHCVCVCVCVCVCLSVPTTGASSAKMVGVTARHSCHQRPPCLYTRIGDSVNPRATCGPPRAATFHHVTPTVVPFGLCANVLGGEKVSVLPLSLSLPVHASLSIPPSTHMCVPPQLYLLSTSLCVSLL